MFGGPVVLDEHDLIQTTLLGEAVENAPLAVLVADDQMGYVAANRAACELLGYDREELLSLRVTDISPFPTAVDQYVELVAPGSLSGQAGLVRKDGTEFESEFWSCSTRVAQMTVYVAFVRPLDEPFF